MRKLAVKKLLPILCSIVVLFGAVATVMVSGATTDFPWRAEKNSVAKILERDGYIEGIWYPWLTHEYLGNGLTSNELMTQYGVNKTKVGLDQYGEIKLYREIYNLKALGFNILGYEGSPYGEGVIYDDNGDIVGVKDEYLDNIRRLLDICKEVGMPVLWSVCFHSSTVPGYYNDGKYAWDVISQAYVNPEIADHYAERFVEPVCDVLAEYPETVIMVASTVELENEMNDSTIGNNLSNTRGFYGGNQEPMLYFMNAITETVKKKLPDVTRTLAANTKDMTIYRNIDFDALGLNHYTINATSPRLEDLKTPLPTICTEFGLGDGIMVDDEVWTQKMIQFRDSFRSNGYTGWVMWDWEPTNFSGGAYSLLQKGGQTTTDFRAGTYALNYYITNYRRMHRGEEEVVLDKPILFCNTGSGTIEWIEPQQVPETYDILRSLDGGKTWKTIAKKLKGQDEEFDSDEDLDGNGKLDDKYVVPGYVQNFKGTYVDEEVANHAADGTTVMYKVTAYDADGESATSDPCNEAVILGPPVNLMEGYNYSFEEGFTGWKHNSNLEQLTGNVATTSDYEVKIVKTLNFTDAEGNPVVVKPSHGSNMMEIKSLKRDSWSGFHISGIQLKPNTAYEIKVDVRIAYDAEYDPNAEGAGRMGTYLNIRGAGPNGENWDKIPGASAYDGGPEDGNINSFYWLDAKKTEWKTYTISFKTNSPKEGEEMYNIGLDWRAYASEAGTPHYYLDNIRIHEVR